MYLFILWFSLDINPGVGIAQSYGIPVEEHKFIFWFSSDTHKLVPSWISYGLTSNCMDTPRFLTPWVSLPRSRSHSPQDWSCWGPTVPRPIPFQVPVHHLFKIKSDEALTHFCSLPLLACLRDPTESHILRDYFNNCICRSQSHRFFVLSSWYLDAWQWILPHARDFRYNSYSTKVCLIAPSWL